MKTLRRAKVGFPILLPFLFVAIGACQTPPANIELGRYFLIDSGPSNHESIISTFATPSSSGQRTLMRYPQYHENSATPWVSQEFAANSQFGVVRTVNLTSGRFVTGNRDMISLPLTTKAVVLLVKLKSVVDIDLSAYPAYVQCDFSMSKPSVINNILNPTSFLNYKQNHLLHAESQLWVKPSEYDRNVRHIQAIVPVEYNEAGEPEFSYVFNYGIYNYIGDSDLWNGFISTSLAHAPSRGSVELAITLVGWYE